MLMASQDAVQLLGLEFPPDPRELHVPALDGTSIHLWHASPHEHSSQLPHLTVLMVLFKTCCTSEDPRDGI